ncbi:armadillo-type protein [Infundibulicybe gibba]|nr:armadillo-type protein [Infundibulicybe gibba]
MSGVYLNTITENASRLGMRIQESFSEHTRDLAITRSATSLYLDTPDDKGKNIRKQLDSNSDREKLDAMKRLVALISKGRNVSEYFAQVVKNVASQNIEIRKLVYIYLLRYAEQEPDLALLSINTFQKDLADSNPLIRAMALRVLSGIKVPMIASIVVLGIKKCAADISPYVRKASALAIPKCYDVAVAFQEVCPTRLDLIHQQYRRFCKILADVDEWGQVDLLSLCLVIASGEEEVDKDVQLLLTSTEPLFQSHNPAVVMAAVRVFYYAGIPSYLPKIVHPLLRLLSISKEVERVVLTYILVISRTAPHLFSAFYPRYLLRSDDVRQVKRDKINLLLSVITFDTHQAILRELIDYSEDPDDEIVAQSIRAVGKCAKLVPECSQQCLSALITMIKSPHDSVVNNAVLVLKYLVHTQLSTSFASTTASPSQSPITIISHLARRIDDIRHAQARACVFWLVGQYSPSAENGVGPEGIADWAPDVLRKGAKRFSQEVSTVKLQIITLAAKLFVLCPSDPTLTRLNKYVFSLARYDLNYDVRDRARLLASLLDGIAPGSIYTNENPEDRGGVVLRREQVKLVLFEGKAGIVEDDLEQMDDPHATLGSISMITKKPMRSEDILPDWLENGVESSLRDVEDEAPAPPVPLAFSSNPQQQQRMRGVPSPVVLTPTGGSSPSGTGFMQGDAHSEEDTESEEGPQRRNQWRGRGPGSGDESDEGSAGDQNSEDTGGQLEDVHHPHDLITQN